MNCGWRPQVAYRFVPTIGSRNNMIATEVSRLSGRVEYQDTNNMLSSETLALAPSNTTDQIKRSISSCHLTHK
jgi:hypothetical protein